MAALAAGTHPRCGARSPARCLGPPCLAALCRSWRRGPAVAVVALGVDARALAAVGGSLWAAEADGAGAGAVVPTDLLCVAVCVPLLAVISVKKLDHKKAICSGVKSTDGCAARTERGCQRWQLVGPHGECVVKRLNSRGESRGTFFFIPAPHCKEESPFALREGGGGDVGGDEGPMFLFEESHGVACDVWCHTENTRWWAWCDGRALYLVDIASMRNGDDSEVNEMNQQALDVTGGEQEGCWAVSLPLVPHPLGVDDSVEHLFVNEVNSNELVMVSISLDTLFLVFDVKCTLKTGSLKLVSATTCTVTRDTAGAVYVSGFMCRKQSGQRVFLVQFHSPTLEVEQCVVIQLNEKSGATKVISTGVVKLCQLTGSLFCTCSSLRHNFHYQIWDCNHTAKPLQEIGPLEGCLSVSGTCGLLFLCYSYQIKVIDALSGVSLLTVDVPSTPSTFPVALRQVLGS